MVVESFSFCYVLPFYFFPFIFLPVWLGWHRVIAWWWIMLIEKFWFRNWYSLCCNCIAHLLLSTEFRPMGWFTQFIGLQIDLWWTCVIWSFEAMQQIRQCLWGWGKDWEAQCDRLGSAHEVGERTERHSCYGSIVMFIFFFTSEVQPTLPLWGLRS